MVSVIISENGYSGVCLCLCFVFVKEERRFCSGFCEY